jgi:hypothetical protein
MVTGEWRKVRKWELLSSACTVRLVEDYSLGGPFSMHWGRGKWKQNWSEIRK